MDAISNKPAMSGKAKRPNGAARMLAIASIAVMTLAAAGCSQTADVSCRAFRAPDQVIAGADQRSQRWIDRTIEAGVDACGWRRPRA